MSSNSEKGFSLYYEDGYAMLHIHPAELSGKQIYGEDIANRMKLMGIPMVRQIKLEEAINHAKGRAVRLVQWPRGARRSPHIELRISPDAMSAEAFVSPPKPGGGSLSLKQFQRALQSRNICYGLKKKVITSLIQKEEYGQWIEIAKGAPPIDGCERKIKYHFNSDRGKPFRELPFGRVDLKELNFIIYREKGTLLAELLPPIPPKDGRNIHGEKIPPPPPGKDEVLKAGNRTEIKGNGIYALENGNVRLERGAVIIEPVVTVNNVDYKTGNLAFQGSVIVKGYVADGFQILASGDIQIGKSVGRVRLEAGRNLLLQSGINGDKEGHIEVGGDLFARFIESTFIRSRGSVFVSGSILKSTVKIDKDLFLEGGRGEIVGGLIVAGGWIKCRKIGSFYETKTNVIAGVLPEELDNFFDSLKEMDELRLHLDNLDRQLHHFQKLCSQSGADEQTWQQKEETQAQVRDFEQQVAEKSREIHRMRRDLKPDPKSFVLAEDMIYIGAKVGFGLLEFIPQNRGVSRTILQVRNEKIHETGYNPARIPEDIKSRLPAS